MPRSVDQQLATAEQRAKVVDLRRQRMTWEEIGRTLGFSKPRAWKIYQEALAAIPTPHVEEHRREELILIDDAIHNLLPLAMGTDEASPKGVANRDRIEAWNAILRFMERKAKMVGLDAPSQLSITIDSVQAEIDKLMREMEASDNA